MRDFVENHQDEAKLWIKPIEECDQDNLPNLLNCDLYKKILKKFVMRRLESVDNIARENFNKCGVGDVIEIVQGSACDVLRDLPDDFHLRVIRRGFRRLSSQRTLRSSSAWM